MNDAELYKLIVPLIEAALKDKPLNNVVVRSATDHDGDAILEVRVNMGSGVEAVGPTLTFEIVRSILDALRDAGENRFPLVTLHYPSTEPEENFFPDRKRRGTGSR